MWWRKEFFASEANIIQCLPFGWNNGNYPLLEVSAMAACRDEWWWDSDVAGCAVIAVRWQRGTYHPTTKQNDPQSGRPYDVDASMSLRTLKNTASNIAWKHHWASL
jgi:hypothetical protein